MEKYDLENRLRSIMNKEVLTENMVFVSLFIAVYENMVEVIVERGKIFLCDIEMQKNDVKYIESSKYKEYIKNKIVDDKGNKNILKATMLWYKEYGAIDEDDYDSFLRLKKVRNNYVHNLYSVLSDGLFQKDVDLFIEMLKLYRKLDIWWINEIEIPLSGELMPEYDIEGVTSFDRAIIQIIVDVLYGESQEKYEEIVDTL